MVASFYSSTYAWRGASLWHFDTGQDAIVKDSSQNGYDGAIQDGTTWTDFAVWRNWVCTPQWGQCQPDSTERKVCQEDGLGWEEPTDCGPIGCDDRSCVEEHALEFDGTGYVRLADDFLTRKQDQSTVEAWIYWPGADEDASHVYTEGHNSKLMLKLGPATDQHAEFSVYCPGDSWSIARWEHALPEGWHHLTGVNTLQKRTLFVDGVPVAESVKECPFDLTDQEASFLGAVYYSGEVLPDFNGIIDEVRVSDTVRYTEAFEPAYRHEQDEDTIGLWHFDKGTGEIVTDSSGNDFDGAFSDNGVTWTDHAVWQNWNCVSGWMSCRDETTLNRCNANRRWVEEEICSGEQSCEEVNSSEAVCQ